MTASRQWFEMTLHEGPVQVCATLLWQPTWFEARRLGMWLRERYEVAGVIPQNCTILVRLKNQVMVGKMKGPVGWQAVEHRIGA